MNTPNLKLPTSNALYLGLDTATPYLSLALWSPEHGVVAHFAETIGRDHAKRLLLELDNLFQKANATPSHLAGIGVGVGPGSYTGVRVGIATAKALAKGLGVPLGGVNTLEATAYGVLKDGERGVVAMDARRGLVYAGVFEKRGENITEIAAMQKVGLEALQNEHSSLPYFQDVCPDAGYSAKSVYLKKVVAVEAVYL
jgi:tRNA threonylcarbamoyladenosine biosynthesis protein TsaB